MIECGQTSGAPDWGSTSVRATISARRQPLQGTARLAEITGKRGQS